MGKTKLFFFKKSSLKKLIIAISFLQSSALIEFRRGYLLIAPLFLTGRNQGKESALCKMRKELNSLDSPNVSLKIYYNMLCNENSYQIT